MELNRRQTPLFDAQVILATVLAVCHAHKKADAILTDDIGQLSQPIQWRILRPLSVSAMGINS